MHDAWCKNKEESNGTVVNVTTAPSFKEKENNTEEVTYALPKLSKAFSEKCWKYVEKYEEDNEKKRGAAERKSYSNSFERTVFGKCHENVNNFDVTNEHRTDKSVLCKWNKTLVTTSVFACLTSCLKFC